MRMKKHLLVFLFFALLCNSSHSLFAQIIEGERPIEVVISGSVVDNETGESLIGVSVIESGTDHGTITDFDGKFIIKVNRPDATLIFRYTGYKASEVPLEGRTTLDIRLSEDAALIDEVVVVGYGIQKKSDLTGSVSSVKGEDINRVATANVEQALQGKVAGVYVAPSSGQPGAGAVIRIRGTGTLNNANPLYVIDGMNTYDASHIHPEDVERIEVLKDASAAAIYGSRGANGVIIITTKQGGARDRALINASAYYGVQQITHQIDLMNAAEFGAAYNDFRNLAYYPDPTVLGEGTDWQNEIFRTAPVSNYTVGANGGSDKYQYNLSANYFSQDGVVKNSHFDRLTVRLNSEYDLNSFMTVGHNIAFSSIREDVAPGVVGTAYRMPPVFAARDTAGNFTDPTFFGLAIANPAADLFYKSNNHNNATRLFGNLFADVKFLKHFTFRSNFGLDKRNNRSRFFEPKFEVSASQRNLNDRLSVGQREVNDWIWEQTLTFDKEWKDHHLTVLAGYTAEERKTQFFTASRENFPGTADELLFLSAGNDTTQLNSGGATDEALVSNLFRASYVFRNTYMITASLRTDKSSRFTKANRTGYFPSASVGWNITNEPFMRSLPWLDRAKVRLSYGVLGNQAAASFYPSTGAVTSGLYGVFGTEENLNLGATLVSLANANLKWETSRQADIGVEVALLDGRFELEVDWYNRETYDIIAGVPIPDYVGSQDDPVVNTARVNNQGFDISANWRDGGKFSYHLGAIISPVKNEVIKLADGRNEILAAFIEGQPATRTVVGLPIGSFYGYKVAGIFQSQEELDAGPLLGGEGIGDLKFEDTNGDGVLNGEDRVYLGSAIPTLTYSFNAGFDFIGFDFNADFIGVSGHKVFNAKETSRFGVYNWEAHKVDRWSPTNTSSLEPRISNSAHNYRVSDYFIQDGSLFRLRNITLGYTLPSTLTDRIKMQKVRVYVTGANVWTLQNYRGYSPEFPNSGNSYEVGLDFGAYPVMKSWQGGVELTF